VRETVEKPHKKLDVWKAAMEATQMVYMLTNTFPAEEKFGLVSQMRRAAVSIPSNIAEGAARQGGKEFRNFLSMAQGSLSELDTQLELAVLLGFLSNENLAEITGHLIRMDKMLTGLIRNLAQKSQNNNLTKRSDKKHSRD
jgi:four helix bundle protein